jgi:hypothetical protein
MSDSIKKWHEMQEDKAAKIFESPDRGQTVTERPFRGDISDRVVIKSKPIISEGDKKLAYEILIRYSEEAILEATRILQSGR